MIFAVEQKGGKMDNIEPERTEYIADIKALPSNRDCIDC